MFRVVTARALLRLVLRVLLAGVLAVALMLLVALATTARAEETLTPQQLKQQGMHVVEVPIRRGYYCTVLFYWTAENSWKNTPVKRALNLGCYYGQGSDYCSNFCAAYCDGAEQRYPIPGE